MYLVNLRFGWKLWWSVLFSIMLVVGWAITSSQADHCKGKHKNDDGCNSGGGGGGGKPPKDDPPVQPNPVIVYQHTTNQGTHFIVADEDGGNNTVVYKGGGSFNQASWCSDDGTDIVFVDEIDGITGVYLLKVVQVDAASGNRTPLVGEEPVLVTKTNNLHFMRPKCSPVPVGPDGYKKIKVAFDDQVNLYLANVNENGTSDPDPVLLLDGSARGSGGLEQFNPSWSPQGDRIVFSSWNSVLPLAYDVEVVEFHWEENNPDPIVNPIIQSLIREEPSSPLFSRDVFLQASWSNIGDQIAVDADGDDPNNHEIWIIPLDNLAGAMPVQYTIMEVLRFEAAWSPDDSQLIYGRNPRQAMCGEDDGRRVGGNVGVVVSNVGGVVDRIEIDGLFCDEVSIHTGRYPDWWRNAPIQ